MRDFEIPIPFSMSPETPALTASSTRASPSRSVPEMQTSPTHFIPVVAANALIMDSVGEKFGSSLPAHISPMAAFGWGRPLLLQ